MTNRMSLAGLAIAAASSLFGIACSRVRPEHVEAMEKQDSGSVPAVAVVRATRRDLSQDVTLTGELVPFQEVEVMAKVAGYVQKMYVDVGDVVRQGQTLAVLEVPEMMDDMARAAAATQRNKAELARAKDEIQRAESAYQMAHLTYTRFAAVDKTQPGLVAQQEIDDAQSRELIASAQVAAAKSTLAAAQEQIKVSEAEQKKIQTLFNYTRVVAPFDGVITKRYADTGSMVQAGTASQTQAMPVVRLSENTLLRLVLPVPESASGIVRAGTAVKVRIPSLTRSFDGKVARIADKVDTSTRTMHIEVDVRNPNRALIPGMYAEVNVSLAQSNGAVVVPIVAVATDRGKHIVRVIGKDNRLEAREVTLGIQTPNESEIRSGVADGELVVTGTSRPVEPGTVVKPKLTEGTA